MLPVQVTSGSVRESVAEDDALQVVCFVLQASGQESGADHSDRFAEGIDSSADGTVRPSQRMEGAGQRKAPFGCHVETTILPFGKAQDRIAHCAVPDVCVLVGATEDEQRQIGRCQPCWVSCWSRLLSSDRLGVG